MDGQVRHVDSIGCNVVATWELAPSASANSMADVYYMDLKYKTRALQSSGSYIKATASTNANGPSATSETSGLATLKVTARAVIQSSDSKVVGKW